MAAVLPKRFNPVVSSSRIEFDHQVHQATRCFCEQSIVWKVCWEASVEILKLSLLDITVFNVGQLWSVWEEWKSNHGSCSTSSSAGQGCCVTCIFRTSSDDRALTSSSVKQTKQLDPSCNGNLNVWGNGGGEGCKLMQTIWQALSPMQKTTDERIQGGQIEVVFTHGQSKKIVLIIALNFSVFCHDFFVLTWCSFTTQLCDSFFVSAVCSRGRRIFRIAVAIHVYLQEESLPCFLSAIELLVWPHLSAEYKIWSGLIQSGSFRRIRDIG